MKNKKNGSSNCFSELPKLGLEEVTIWLFKTSELLKYEKKIESVISSEEKKRSKAFYFIADSKRFVCAHGILRMILAKYTNHSPISLSFKFDSSGKPELNDNDNIKFNLSHTKDLIAIAITENKEVGVDVEKCVQLSGVDDMSRNIMHEDELLEYFSLPGIMRDKYFYRCWVKKESIVKAWGTGLYEDLRNIKVMNKKSPHISPQKIIDKFNRKNEWYIEDLDTINRHYGAVCYEGPRADIKIFNNEVIKQLLPLLN